jgi:hypothetical protein
LKNRQISINLNVIDDEKGEPMGPENYFKSIDQVAQELGSLLAGFIRMPKWKAP